MKLYLMIWERHGKSSRLRAENWRAAKAEAVPFGQDSMLVELDGNGNVTRFLSSRQSSTGEWVFSDPGDVVLPGSEWKQWEGGFPVPVSVVPGSSLVQVSRTFQTLPEALIGLQNLSYSASGLLPDTMKYYSTECTPDGREYSDINACRPATLDILYKMLYQAYSIDDDPPYVHRCIGKLVYATCSRRNVYSITRQDAGYRVEWRTYSAKGTVKSDCEAQGWTWEMVA